MEPNRVRVNNVFVIGFGGTSVARKARLAGAATNAFQIPKALGSRVGGRRRR